MKFYFVFISFVYLWITIGCGEESRRPNTRSSPYTVVITHRAKTSSVSKTVSVPLSLTPKCWSSSGVDGSEVIVHLRGTENGVIYDVFVSPEGGAGGCYAKEGILVPGEQWSLGTVVDMSIK